MLKLAARIIVTLSLLVFFFHVPHVSASASAYRFYREAQKEAFMFKKVALYDKAIEINASFVDARKARAKILYYQGKYRQAEEDLNYCIKNGEATGAIYALLGKVHMAQKKYQEAEKDFSAALEFDPQNRLILLERAKARYLTENYKGAWDDARSIIRQGVKDNITDQAYKIAGFVLLKSGKASLARENFKMAATSDDFAFGGFYNHIYDPRRMSFLGMLGLIIGVLALIFRIELPPPRRRK